MVCLKGSEERPGLGFGLPQRSSGGSMRKIALSLAIAIGFVLMAVSGAWAAATEQVLYSFTDGSDGGYPMAGLIFDAAGNLYGTTSSGGVYDQGTVFELSPSNGTWTETVLYNFRGQGDGG